MAFTGFRQLSDVLKKYQIRYEEQDFPMPAQATSVPEVLRDDIRFTLNEVAYDISESAICENLIYPVLKTAWRQHADILAIWSHQPLGEGELSGVPDYVISKKSELGKIVFEAPYVAVVEAKKDDFTAGWAQCGLEMHTMQQLNATPDLPVHGIVSNGETWEIAMLHGNVLVKYRQIFQIHRLDELYTALLTVLGGYRKFFAAAEQ
ncbi:MAG: hypothetical protein ACK4Q5_05215 [Saprospiraceae bacterium]